MATPVLAPHGRMITVTVYCRNGKISTSLEPFRLSKTHFDQIMWVAADPSLPFTVDFDEPSPFYEDHFDNLNCCSGLVRREVPGDGKTYKYTLRTGGHTLDPHGIIDP